MCAALDLLYRVGVRVLGTVATNLPKERRDRAGYGYGYAYGAPEDTTATGVTAPAVDRPRPARRGPNLLDELDGQRVLVAKTVVVQRAATSGKTPVTNERF